MTIAESLQSFLSRKFIAYLFTNMLAMFMPGATGQEKLMAIVGLFAAYAAANVTQKIAAPNTLKVTEKSTMEDGTLTTEKKTETPTAEPPPVG